VNESLPAVRRFLFPVDLDLTVTRAQTRARDLLAFACADAGLQLECEPRWDLTDSGASREGLAVATVLVVPVPGDEEGLSEAVLAERVQARKAWARARHASREALVRGASDADWTAAETARWFGISVSDVCRYGWPATFEAGGFAAAVN
jgi:hypothetical protein